MAKPSELFEITQVLLDAAQEHIRLAQRDIKLIRRKLKEETMRHQLWLTLVLALLIPAEGVPAAETVTLTADEGLEMIAALDDLKVTKKELGDLKIEHAKLLEDYGKVVIANEQLYDQNLGLKIATGILSVISLILIIIVSLLKKALI